MKTTERLLHHLSATVVSASSIRLLTILVYIWFLVNVLLVWNVKDLLWGVDNVFYRQGRSDTLIENFFYQLIYDAGRFKIIFYLHIIGAICSIPEFRFSFLPRLITWATGWMLFYAAIEAFNSGMMLMLMLAFYCSVVYTKSTSPYRIVLTNLARYACIIQITLVYLVAAVYKISGDQWPAGTALYYTLNIDHFSSAAWQKSGLIHSMWLMKTMTWTGLIYQVLFPFIIWIKKGRTWFLLAGVAFHLFIGMFLHLWDFAFAMIFAYAVFLDEKFTSRILKKIIPAKRAAN